jgi:hypothetical protein
MTIGDLLYGLDGVGIVITEDDESLEETLNNIGLSLETEIITD